MDSEARQMSCPRPLKPVNSQDKFTDLQDEWRFNIPEQAAEHNITADASAEILNEGQAEKHVHIAEDILHELRDDEVGTIVHNDKMARTQYGRGSVPFLTAK